MRAKTFDDLGWPQLLQYLAARCHTSLGEAAARALPLFELVDDARRRIAEITEARLLYQLETPMPFGGVKDVRESLARVERGGDLAGPELVAVAETVRGCALLRRHLAARTAEAPLLAKRAEPIAELGHVSGPILDSFEEGGRLSDHASPQLGPMRRKVSSLHEELGKRVQRLLDDERIAPYLQDRFYTQRDERYVVPLRAEARARVPGIVHGTSQSGQTVFVEPEDIVDLNNRLKMAESDVEEEERRILAQLSAYVREEIAPIRTGLGICVELDVLDAAARLADATEAAAPEITDGGIDLRHARHPLMLLAGRACVPNDLLLGAGRTMIVSGPNAGGKTVALKTLGLAALLVRAGLHVPADPGSHLPWFTRIETDIGDDQSIEKNLSTFSAHIFNLIAFLDGAGAGTLLLVDELAAGTDPEQGAALAQAVLEAFAARGVAAMVTTHYERLKALPTQDTRFVNASVGFDLEKMAPTFRLHLDIPGSSGAFLLARRLGLAGQIVGRAEELLGDRRTGIEELLTAVTEERRRLDAERAAADTARREADRARREAEVAARASRAREEQLRRGAYDETVAALRRARDEIDRVKARLKDAGKDDVRAAKDALAGIAAEAERHAPSSPERGVPGRPASEEELVVGAAVIVPHLGRGKIVGAPERGRVTVQIGSLRTSATVGEVRLDETPPPPRGVKRRAAAAAAAVEPAPAEPKQTAEMAVARTPDATCDLRGQRVDESLSELDRFLDDQLLQRRDVAFVIHGHGTGALRTAVREHLELHAGVTKWRPGNDREGGDGITVVWLDV